MSDTFSINANDYGPRAQLHFQSIDRSKGEGRGSVDEGAKIASRLINNPPPYEGKQGIDLHKPSIFSRAEADAIDAMKKIRLLSQGVQPGKSW